MTEHLLSPSVSAHERQPGALAGFYQQQLSWNASGEDSLAGLECTSFSVPLDYSQPDGRTLSIALVRHKATIPVLRRGVLLIAPDDPGNRGMLLAGQLVKSLPENVLTHYDLVGFDHRFSGHSTPFDCGLTQEETSWIFHYPRSFDEEIRFQATIAAKAAEHTLDILPYITTRNIARDMDVIRGVLGEEKISFLGYSYGTYLGAVYTQMFGEHTDRVVLDSVISPDWVWRGLFLNVAESAEGGLMRWAQWTATRDMELHLGTSDQDVRASYNRLLEQVDREPMVVSGLPLDAGNLRLFTMALLSTDLAYGFLADIIRVGVHGGQLEPTTLGALAGMFGQRNDNTPAAQLALQCNDSAWPRHLDLYQHDMDTYNMRFPFMGAALAGVKAGAFWPVPPREPVTLIGPDNRAETILLVQSAHDMFTQSHGALRLRELLPHNSRLIMVANAAHHRVYPFYGNPDANAATTEYLVTGKLPDQDITCPNAQISL